MSTYFLLFCMIGLALADPLKCTFYNCYEFKDNICSSINKTFPDVIGFNLKACPDKTVCNLQFGDEPDTCAPNYTIPLRYPGEACKNPEECFSGNCNSVCTGKKVDEACSDDADCDVELFCNLPTLKCKAVSKFNESCSTVIKCGAGLVCNDGTCLSIGSIENGKPASAPAACKSFYISGGNCTKGPILVAKSAQAGEDLHICKDKCQYQLGEGLMEPEFCQCGMTPDPAKSFCPPGRGELDLKDVIFFYNSISILLGLKPTIKIQLQGAMLAKVFCVFQSQ